MGMVQTRNDAQMASGGALTELTIVVTGAGSGIGRSTAELAAAAGATVVCADVKAHDETVSLITDAGGKAESHELDVTDAGAWRSAIDSVLDRHGKIDGLANVAGIVTDADTVVDQTEEGWDRIVGVDLKGTWLGMKTVLPSMIEAGRGRVVNVASTAGLIGMQNVAAYSAAKGGVIGLSRQAAVEYAPTGVMINTVAPGVIETPMHDDVGAELMEHVKAATPVGRIGNPADIGNMIVFLLGPGGDFITGQTIAVDGGWTAQ
jgi:NAD(P)-dependent dehydrogenase (short-subunit alcohol dehydrogenase family)